MINYIKILLVFVAETVTTEDNNWNRRVASFYNLADFIKNLIIIFDTPIHQDLDNNVINHLLMAILVAIFKIIPSLSSYIFWRWANC